MLEALAKRGHANGVMDLELVDRAFVRRCESHVAAAALWSPSSGIVEAEAYVRALARVAAAPVPWSTRRACTPTTSPPRSAARPSRSTRYGGDYTELTPAARHLVNGPVYPLPDPSGHGSGVHLTRTTWGSVTLGPTSRYQARKDDYESNRDPLAAFHAAARRLLPGVELEQLRTGGSGIRGARGPGRADLFRSSGSAATAGKPRLVQAAGIDSPGLTASLAIAERVADLVDETLA